MLLIANKRVASEQAKGPIIECPECRANAGVIQISPEVRSRCKIAIFMTIM